MFISQINSYHCLLQIMHNYISHKSIYNILLTFVPYIFLFPLPTRKLFLNIFFLFHLQYGLFVLSQKSDIKNHLGHRYEVHSRTKFSSSDIRNVFPSKLGQSATHYFCFNFSECLCLHACTHIHVCQGVCVCLCAQAHTV